MIRRRFVTLNEMFDKWHHSRVNSWMDRLTFPHILLVWMGIILLFGLTYHHFSTQVNHLYYNQNQQPVQELSDAIYFSFITATSTGFGDIVPLGGFKVIAILEVIFGLLLLAFVTSKLVSLKQDIILNEIYEMSFQERINRLRSALLLFRQHLSRLVSRIEEQAIQKREINELYIYLSSFEDTLNEISSLLDSEKKHYFTKEIDEINAELIVNSINSSFEKLREFIALCTQKQVEWKRDIALNLLERGIMINETIFAKLPVNLSQRRIGDLRTQNKEIINAIQREVQGR